MALLGDILQELKVLLIEGPFVLIQLFGLILQSVYNFLVPVGFRAKEVHGETVLITGAGSGLGRLTAIKLSRRGCCLVIWDVNKTGNDETARLIREEGGLVHAYQVNLCDRSAIYACAEKVKTEVGDVDILINNAGIVSGKRFLDTPDELIERTMNVNINAHFWTVKSFLPSMVKNNHGHVVTIASTAGLIGVSGLVDYHASKFAAVGFDESLRDELAYMGASGVNTTCVCPLFINTGMFEGVKSKLPLSLPILDQDYVTNKIIEAILTNQQMVVLPKITYFLMSLKWCLPTRGITLLQQFTGCSSSMDSFTGRKSE